MKQTLMRAILCGFLALTFTSASSALEANQAEDLYRQGQDDLNSGRYEAALDSFSRLVDESSTKSDRALYWQAYTLNKIGRKNEALRSLRRLVNEHPKSPWRDDAEALQIEIEGVSGDDPIDLTDDDLKLYALDALHQVEPEKAVDLLEKFLAGDHSKKLKEHALFMLAQTGSDRASKILVDMARGNQGQGMQRQAIEALGMVDDESSRKTLLSLYKNSNDHDIKRTVIESMIVSDSRTELAELVRNEKDPELVQSGLRTLGAMGAGKELKEFLRTLPAEHHPAALEGLGIAGDAQAILDVMKGSKDESLTMAAVEALAIVGSKNNREQISSALTDLYRSSGSKRVKSQVLQAMMIQDDGEALLRIFRSEKDGELKREALQALTMIESPETEKLIEDLLEG